MDLHQELPRRIDYETYGHILVVAVDSAWSIIVIDDSMMSTSSIISKASSMIEITSSIVLDDVDALPRL